MRFGILGTTKAWRGDASEVPLGGPARRALLTLLLARAGETVTADGLVDDLYGAGSSDGAAHALRSQVSRLRRALGPEVTIEAVPAGYRIAADPDDVDAHRFERLADEGRLALRDGDAARAASLLRQALGLWRGSALADAADAGSVRGRIIRLEERRLGAVEDRIEADLRRGEHPAVVPELRELVARHPLRERLHGLLMRALQAAGLRAEALAAFEETRRLLAAELGTDPSAELAAIHRGLLRGERPFEPPRPPAQLTSFVGRAQDMARVSELLGTSRLVTLLGPGGAGKTRLAIEVAARRSGVCFVELAALRDGRQLPQTLLGSLGIREGGLLTTPPAAPGETPSVARLIAALAERPPLLLVLDNCEHVVDATATLAEELLAGCPRLRILVTSREPLGITGEHLWPVRPLTPSHAARLFADRASAVRAGFTMDDPGAGTGVGTGPGTDAEAVRRICHALDGLPLAIELAAARMRTYDAPELAARLDDRFRLLSRGSRTADPRHRTLRAVVAWSWDLLSGAEQVMARRLAVFSGGATAEAARRVCGVAEAEELLESLADKSLLEVSGRRYRMLDTIRAYCAEQLDAAGETRAMRHAHAGHFLRLAQTADPLLRRAGQLEWLETLTAEHDNLHTALRWAVEAEETALALELLASLSSYLWMRGMRTSVTAQAAGLLEAIGDGPPRELQDEYVLCVLATAAGEAGRDAWERHRATAESIITGPGGPHRHPMITFLWPMINSSAEDPHVTLSVLARGQAGSDPWERAVVHLMWGYPQLAHGDLAWAEHEFTSAVDAFRSLGDRWGTALALDALAGLANLRGDHRRAIALTGEAIALAERLGAIEDVSDLLCGRGDHRVRAALAGGGPAGTGLVEARADYERAAKIARRAGAPTCLAGALRGLGDLARLAGDLAGARRLYEQALDRLEKHWIRSAEHWAGALCGLGMVTEASGDLPGARALHHRAAEVMARMGLIAENARVAGALAGIALREGDARTAARLLGAAGTLRGVHVEDDPAVSRTAAGARAALGDAGYEAAHREGARLSRQDALRLTGVPESVIRMSPINSVTGRELAARRTVRG
ncbi:putative ATPase/DNA-binding SARP family transcriptional activator [Streptosporangium becharense]|uniref:Putative ATPase/DNA-binding SARP family transcriptional activator n=1 Tax=Streptosporangium becharense TaxID=1816182 RepID=A0A7W9IDS5_9ACTN|nr:BTAD domain-containing putative transcriptional regulator [Streptosporangium becharense]MBB2912303.1 putative ATPase/DNA-binding SARP family transcriptional activator [Streptosporangium becharense]MBB5818850.1 putative ATPase/DNA-binding SARP family transcriptional activator [Streptosporangium becharense]